MTSKGIFPIEHAMHLGELDNNGTVQSTAHLLYLYSSRHKKIKTYWGKGS